MYVQLVTTKLFIITKAGAFDNKCNFSLVVVSISSTRDVSNKIIILVMRTLLVVYMNTAL